MVYGVIYVLYSYVRYCVIVSECVSGSGYVNVNECVSVNEYGSVSECENVSEYGNGSECVNVSVNEYVNLSEYLNGIGDDSMDYV